MIGALHYGFIAQLCSVLAPLSLKGAIYIQSRTPGSWRSSNTVTT
jgi:hypothetical protein